MNTSFKASPKIEGSSGGRPVIVRPDRLNQFSRDQICVRGRFHYDAVTDGQRLQRSLARSGARPITHNVFDQPALTQAQGK